MLKANALLIGCLSLTLFAACDSKRENVQEARQELQETQSKAAADVSESKMDAVKEVNEAKKDAAEDVIDKREDLAKAQAESTSGTTSTATTADHADHKAKVAPTADECTKLAAEKSVKPEDKAKYEACSKMKTK